MSKHNEARSSTYPRAVIELERLLTKQDASRDLLGQYCRALLLHFGDESPELSNENCKEKVLHEIQPKVKSRFFAAALLRLLAASPQELLEKSSYGGEERVAVLKLLNELPDVQNKMGVDRKEQPHEILRKLEGAVPKAEEIVAGFLVEIRSLRAFDATRNGILSGMANPLVAALVVPFLPTELSKKRLDPVLKAVSEYLSSPVRERIQAYAGAARVVTALLDELEPYKTRYVDEMFLPFLRSLHQALVHEYENSSLTKDGVLRVVPQQRSYPFAVGNAEVRLAFSVENRGSGVALDAQLRVEPEDSVSVKANSQLLDDLEPTARIEPVEFVCSVVKPSDQAVVLECVLTWRNANDSSGEYREIFELGAQRSDILWEELETTDPYSLEPVDKKSELVGREEQLKQLVARVRAQSVGSVWIHGQKRVGKTSLVRTLRSVLETSEDGKLTMIDLEAGDYIDADAEATINALGTKICKRIRATSDELRDLPIPQFNGALSPLDDYLQDAISLVPDLRLVIVLDEFDSLPRKLYEREGVGKALFMTLRSLSGKGRFGFILVGGENMSEIMVKQGEVLNKFHPMRIGYLELDSHWSDFVKLVRRPIESWAEVTDGAVRRLYDASAGNPFFAKFICANMFASMVERRDAYVTANEAEQAIRRSVLNAGSNQFQHFWEDGISSASEDQAEAQRVERRRVLMAYGETLRSSDSPTFENVSSHAKRIGLTIGHEQVKTHLMDFDKRHVFERRGDEYMCRVGLFRDWLIDCGIKEIALSFSEQDAQRVRVEEEERLRVKGSEISQLIERWGSYQGRRISAEDTRIWLDQFDSVQSQRLMFQLLEAVRFYSGELLREKLKVLHGSVMRELAGRGAVRRKDTGARKQTDNILISFFGGDGKRGATYAKLYTDENDIYFERVVSPGKLLDELRNSADVAAVVFVDDFVGTGASAIDGMLASLRPIASALESRDIEVFLTCVSGFDDAAARIRREVGSVYPIQVRIADPLGNDARCFSTEAGIFGGAGEREEAKRLASDVGVRLEKKAPLGFGGCEALVVFEDTCPNNSLPILWKKADSWKPLFERK